MTNDTISTETIEGKLAALGLSLPRPTPPVANYVGSVLTGNLLFVGGNTGRFNGARKFSGVVGATVTLEQAYEMARFCALNHLAGIKAALGGFDRVERFVMLTGYVTVAPGFDQMPKVINGASDLLVALWGKRGEHTRAALGVAALGDNAPVETTLIIEVKS